MLKIHSLLLTVNAKKRFVYKMSQNEYFYDNLRRHCFEQADNILLMTSRITIS